MKIRRTVVVIAASVLFGLAVTVLLATLSNASPRRTPLATSTQAQGAVAISGHAEVNGGPIAIGQKAPMARPFSGVIGVYEKAAATGKLVLLTNVSVRDGSYSVTLRSSGTYFVVPETTQDVKQAAGEFVTVGPGDHKIVDLTVDVP